MAGVPALAVGPGSKGAGSPVPVLGGATVPPCRRAAATPQAATAPAIVPITSAYE